MEHRLSTSDPHGYPTLGATRCPASSLIQSLTENHGLPTVKAALRFAKIRLLSHPKAAPLEGGITSVRDAVLKAEEDPRAQEKPVLPEPIEPAGPTET